MKLSYILSGLVALAVGSRQVPARSGAKFRGVPSGFEAPSGVWYLKNGGFMGDFYIFLPVYGHEINRCFFKNPRLS
jgi:hypothetical protein